MSDEEKKAIKGLEWSQQQMRLGNLPDYDQGHYADIRIVLNLIEKQSKEIEELKEVKWYYEISRVPKDKIKAKIEEIDRKIELEKEIEELKEENEKYKNPPFFDEDKYTENDKIKAKIEEVDYKMVAHQDVREAVKQILQSLLEKE